VKRILIADDRAVSRELVREALASCGHEILEAADGLEALRLARETQPELIILDLHMPNLDGIGAVQELRRDGRFASTPIVALTASAMQGDREKALAAGFSSWIAKPISLRALRAEVERLLL